MGTQQKNASDDLDSRGRETYFLRKNTRSESSMESKADKNGCLPPEVEFGNVEYKLKLVNPSISRFKHLVTQMKWRLQEGNGEAVYEIGVEDNGCLAGLTRSDLNSSLETAKKMTEELGADMSVIREYKVDCQATDPHYAAELLVRCVPDNMEFIDVRIAVLGNVDAGKSTLLGVLAYHEMDNGRGRARLNLFRHLHEIQSGRTSSISHEFIGFDCKGEVINSSECSTAEEICTAATKMITLIDLAGHQKYMKTTILGLTGYCPEAVMLVVSGNTGIVGTTKEHLGLAVALKIPLLVVVTKIDVCGEAALERIFKQLDRILKSPVCRKIPMIIENEDDSIIAASNFPSGKITPIFKVSSVSGENLDLLKKFLFLVPPIQSVKEKEKLLQEPVTFNVDEIFTVTDVGPVLAGTLTQGVVREGDRLFLGPNDHGKFVTVIVTSIHRNRSPCRVILAGQAATVAVSGVDENTLRRGLVLVDSKLKPYSCFEFEAEVFVLFHTSSISNRYQCTVHINNVRQTAIIEQMNKKSICTGQRAKVRFRFINKPEYIQIGSRILFRDGHSKGIGEITQVYYYRQDLP